MEVGVVGLGSMGAAIAARILAAGHEVTVYNRSPGKADALLAKGATLAHEPAGAASGDVVITILADDRAVESVAFDAASKSEGLIAHQGKKTIHISMSTISPQLAKRLDEASSSLSKQFISATVFGRPDVAKRGELIVMAAGETRLIKSCKPVFDAIASSVHAVGDRPEKSNIAKLAGNFMISSMIETFSEAFALLRKNDIDHHKFLQVMASEFFCSPVYEKYGQLIANEKFDTGAFTVRLQEKDTRLVLEAAIASQVPMPFASVLENVFLSAIGRGKGDLDPCAISQVATENAGIGNKRAP